MDFNEAAGTGAHNAHASWQASSICNVWYLKAFFNGR